MPGAGADLRAGQCRGDGPTSTETTTTDTTTDTTTTEPTSTETTEAETTAPQLPVVELPAAAPFKDVSSAHPFYREMTWMSQSGISKGWATADGAKEYRPHTPVDRDVMAAFLYRMAGEPAFTAPAVSPFADVTPQDTFYKEMTWMAEQGISKGWSTTEGKVYRPHAAVDRDVMAAFLYRLTPLI